jgi:ABC-2 type transport system ATP-binding protein
MIQLDAVGKTYGPRRAAVHALHQVSLDMGPGVWAVVGPNGAGKSTLLGLTLGFLHPSAGTVRLAGLSPRRFLRRHGVGYLPERFHLPPPWTVGGALRALARLEGLPPAQADARAGLALEQLGLEPYADRAIGTLSRGLNQRLGLAQTLLGRHDLIVLDEPTEGLDPIWRVRFRDLVAELREEGRTILLASHELAEVERLADRVLLLDGGRIIDVLDVQGPRGPTSRYRLEIHAPGEALDLAFPGARHDARSVTVAVADPAELSHRLAAFLEAGGILHAVIPLDTLEERVRRRLEEP